MSETSPDPNARVLMAVADHGTTILDLVAGQRQKAIAAGFNETAAEQMAVQMHGALWQQFAFSTRVTS